MSDSTPEEVLIEFLRLVSEAVEGYESSYGWDSGVLPVLRGSLLLRHWYGELARPAADIDLECFSRPQTRSIPDEQRQYFGDGVGPYGEFDSLVDYGKAMCRYAAEASSAYRWRRSEPPSLIEFQQIESPEGGSSLWTYGTPGERYYAGWVWRGDNDQTGRLQIDIAQAAAYELEHVDVADVHFVSVNGTGFRFPAYTPEMLLAAKVSWLLRSLKRRSDERGGASLEWTGEPKDLFDIHLLLSNTDFRTDGRQKLLLTDRRDDLFQKSLLAVGAADELDWSNLDAIFDVRSGGITDAAFANWREFETRHAALLPCGPTEMLRQVADRLAPLLGDFYRAEEAPFLQAIHADPVNEFPYAIYADWLEDRGDSRCECLRRYLRYNFHRDEPSAGPAARAALYGVLRETSQPWLHRLMGTSARVRDLYSAVARNTQS